MLRHHSHHGHHSLTPQPHTTASHHSLTPQPHTTAPPLCRPSEATEPYAPAAAAAAAGCLSFGQELLPPRNVGNFTWPATANGSYFFKCNVGAHCTAGNMVLPVTVTGCPSSQLPMTNKAAKASFVPAQKD
jgi:hypothetical protein